MELLAEIKKLKTFLHFINMESGDGLSYRISKRMQTIYGYFGIIRNLQLQLKEVKEYAKRSIYKEAASYIHMLQKELAYWKKIIYNFFDAEYDFIIDKQDLLATLPNRLTKKSILKFIHYTLYELNTMSDRADDVALNNVRKFLEDIYYNYDLMRSFLAEQKNGLTNEKAIEECLALFNKFDCKTRALDLLRTVDTKSLEMTEQQFLKEMGNEWLKIKTDLKNRLIIKLSSLNIKVNNLQELSIANEHK